MNHNPSVGEVWAVRAGMRALPPERGHPVGGLDVMRHLGGVGGGVAALGTLLLGHGDRDWDHLTLNL